MELALRADSSLPKPRFPTVIRRRPWKSWANTRTASGTSVGWFVGRTPIFRFDGTQKPVRGRIRILRLMLSTEITRHRTSADGNVARCDQAWGPHPDHRPPMVEATTAGDLDSRGSAWYTSIMCRLTDVFVISSVHNRSKWRTPRQSTLASQATARIAGPSARHSVPGQDLVYPGLLESYRWP